LSNKDAAKREILASELGQLKEEYSQMEQAYDELKTQASQIQPQGFVTNQQPPANGLGQLQDTFYQEANIEVTGEVEQPRD